ncbi:YaaC family protein [Halobacillus sp. A5]|uniref:YaaC family protein n=1 Tax=Halobacillus sp. A5 TaxID=2880263 RepID=UPI0020A6A289|nr:YaaC family protein [Halobacillus sp. A5]MCP3026918.1 YaaC family protein [Halobacillus sp. A5]
MANQDLVFLTYLKSTSHTREYLNYCYRHHGEEQAKLLAYENAERFSYGLQLGEEFLTSAAQTPFSVKPLLYYYSLTHFLKSCIVTVDPAYPTTSKVLAHGLSTRKRKKQHYRFLEDEIRIQPHGLFPYAASSLFGIQTFPNKVSMDHLLHPLLFMQAIYDYKEKRTPKTPLFPELTASFAVLYNLSMLVRYEGEWWGEMMQLRDREDYVFIHHFLDSMPHQIYHLTSSWLKKQSPF